MPQSLAKVYIHLVFSTKYNKSIIKEKYRKELQAIIVSILAKENSFTDELYANPSHIHVLCTLPRTITIAQLVLKVKAKTSRWLKTKGINNFKWQDGYAVFSVSSSKVPVVRNYIIKQPEHHKKLTYKEELRAFFERYQVKYDERYVWD